MKLIVLLSLVVFFILLWITHKEPSLVIVTSHWKEDLNWLKKSKYPVVLIDHEGSEPPAIEHTTIIPNKGNESSSYIRYILDNWDSLPDYVAFIHGHETSHHQKYKEPILEIIERAHLTSDFYLPLNGMWLGEPAPSSVKKDYYLQIAKYWYLFEPYMKKYPEQPLFTDACAQFIVSRNKITQYPLEAWQTWYDALIIHHPEVGFVFEYTWHYLFNQPWRMKPKPIRLRS